MAVACGGSSGSNGPAQLQPGDIAVVGATHITKGELDHQIKLEVRSLELGAESCKGGSQGSEDCTDRKGPVPRVGTAEYTTTIVQPVVAYLVTEAKIRHIAKQLGIVVTPAEIRARVAAAVQQLYGGDQARYRAELEKHGLTEADANEQVAFTLLEQKIEAKLGAQVKVTPDDVLNYYESHMPLYETDAATRQVEYVLVASRAAATRARAAIASGGTFADVAKGAIDDSALHGTFVATEGRLDKAFEGAALRLPTNALSQPIAVGRAYARSSLAGRCKPTCYFVIHPTAPVVKGGTQQPFASVQAKIRAQLLSIGRSRHVQAVIEKLEKAQRKLTRYAPGYAPPKSSTPATGVPDTDDTAP